MSFYYLVAQKFLNISFRISYGLKIKGVRRADWQNGMIITSNHQCFLDPLIVGSAAPKEMYYFAKEEIFTWPVIGFLAKKFNAFPAKRSAFDLEAIRTANSVLKQNKNLLVFIEGTRSRDGQLLPPKKGVGMLAFQNQVDIIPAYVHGSFHLRRSFFRYPGLMVLFGKKIKIQDYLRRDLPKKEMYQLISQKVMNQIKGLQKEALTYLNHVEYPTSTEVNKIEMEETTQNGARRKQTIS
jgi:1-acyl-sn-glycerol-3-phosphate acyltransferase